MAGASSIGATTKTYGSMVTYRCLILFLLIAGIKSQESPTVNIVFIYQDEENTRLFDAAKEFVERNPSLSVKVGTVHRYLVNGTEPLKLTKEFCEEMDRIMSGPDRPDIAIDFTRIGIPSESVKVVLRTMQMPTIAATFGQEGDVREWREMSDNQQKYMIQISPPADILMQAVRSIVDKQNMTSAVVLFDEQYEMYHKYKSLLQNLPTRHLLTRVEEKSKLYAQIDKLVHVDIVNFFIAATPGQISEVLSKASNPTAKDGPWFSDEYAWYSMSMGEGIPNCAYCDLPVSVVHLTPETPKAGEMKRNFLTGQLSITSATLTDMFYFDVTLDAILAVGDMKSKQRWNHNISNNTCANYKSDKTYPELDLDLISFFETASMENTLGEKFVMGGNGKNYPQFEMKIRYLKFEKNEAVPNFDDTIGKWKSGYGEPSQLEYEENKNLTNHMAQIVFRVVTVVQPPFVYKTTKCENPGTKYENCFEGYCIDLLKEIQKELQFKFIIKNVSGYGYMSEDGEHEWNGMVKELKDRQADIALGAMSVMAERESVVDFTVPYYDLVGISILMKKPKATTSLFKFLTVLENDVWMCILGAYFFTSFLMWIFDRWSPYSYQNNREKYEEDEEKREFNLKECLWFCMTSLTPQGGGEAPKNLSGRLVAATWWLFGFIIIASYTANLAAFLTVSRLDAPIESLDDLSKQYKVQYAPLRNSSAWVYFDRMAHIEHRFYEIWKDMSLNDSMSDYERSQLAVWDYPVSDKFTKMWQAMLENDPPETFDGAVNRVRGKILDNGKEADGFAFLDEATNIKYQTTISCEFDMKGEEFSRKPYAIAVQKGSPLKESFSHMILKLLNQRFLEQLKEKWWNENPAAKKCPREDNQSDGISIHNIGGVFIVIFVGIIMACFTLIFEYWWYRKRNVAEELAEMALPPPKEFVPAYNNEKTNFNTQYNKQVGAARADLPSIENSW